MKIIAWPAFKTKYKNPYNWLLYSCMLEQRVTVNEFSFRKLLSHNHDIFHLHWPTETIVRHPNPFIACLRAATMLLVIDWARFRGTKIIWTIHDEYPHSLLHPKLAAWFQSQFIKRVDGFISHSQVGKELVVKTYPRLRDSEAQIRNRTHVIIPHGHYRQIYPNKISREAARSNLDIPLDCHLLLFLGYIDYYKNIPRLVQVFKELAPTNWMLLIAGKVEVPELGTQIQEIADHSSRVKLNFGFVPDEQLQLYFRAANLVVLPFQEILNSGSALLALSFDCPILVPQKGALTELQQQVGVEWLKLYSGDLTTEVLSDGLDWAVQEVRSQQVNLEKLEWSQLSQQTIEAYQKTLKEIP